MDCVYINYWIRPTISIIINAMIYVTKNIAPAARTDTPVYDNSSAIIE